MSSTKTQDIRENCFVCPLFGTNGCHKWYFYKRDRWNWKKHMECKHRVFVVKKEVAKSCRSFDDMKEVNINGVKYKTLHQTDDVYLTNFKYFFKLKKENKMLRMENLLLKNENKFLNKEIEVLKTQFFWKLNKEKSRIIEAEEKINNLKFEVF